MSQSETGFINHYIHCRTNWSDEWSCMCNTDCPECGHEIEPVMSEVINPVGDNELVMHVGPDYIPEDGWPEDITNLEDLKESVL